MLRSLRAGQSLQRSHEDILARASRGKPMAEKLQFGADKWKKIEVAL
jgi:hypothetical protein